MISEPRACVPGPDGDEVGKPCRQQAAGEAKTDADHGIHQLPVSYEAKLAGHALDGRRHAGQLEQKDARIQKDKMHRLGRPGEEIRAERREATATTHARTEHARSRRKPNFRSMRRSSRCAGCCKIGTVLDDRLPRLETDHALHHPDERIDHRQKTVVDRPQRAGGQGKGRKGQERAQEVPGQEVARYWRCACDGRLFAERCAAPRARGRNGGSNEQDRLFAKADTAVFVECIAASFCAKRRVRLVSPSVWFVRRTQPSGEAGAGALSRSP